MSDRPLSLFARDGGGGLPHDAPTAFARYESVRSRLPAAHYPATSQALPTLSEVAEHYDGFLLDAFGVLNIGDTAIPGAVARMAELRRRGKRLAVLTNAASYTRSQLLEKYHRLGFDFTEEEVTSSRDIAAAQLEQIAPGARWAAFSAPGDTYADIGATLVDAIADPTAFDTADGFLFLSTARWSLAWQDRLHVALLRRPRPLVIANPDLVAPNEAGLTLEPGLFGHMALDATGVDLHWFGKPFKAAFEHAVARTGLPAARLAMVGDTLHTDTIGGVASGCGTVLVTDHGLFKGHDVGGFISASGIVPDYIIKST